jgi:hypothetical protein
LARYSSRHPWMWPGSACTVAQSVIPGWTIRRWRRRAAVCSRSRASAVTSAPAVMPSGWPCGASGSRRRFSPTCPTGRWCSPSPNGCDPTFSTTARSSATSRASPPAPSPRSGAPRSVSRTSPSASSPRSRPTARWPTGIPICTCSSPTAGSGPTARSSGCRDRYRRGAGMPTISWARIKRATRWTPHDSPRCTNSSQILGLPYTPSLTAWMSRIAPTRRALATARRLGDRPRHA